MKKLMKYKAIFSNREGAVNAMVEDLTDVSSVYCFPLTIDEVVIETDGFEELSIAESEKYAKDQLARFDYHICYPYKDKNRQLLVLEDYRLDTFIPIFVRETESGKRREAVLCVEMIHNGKDLKRTCRLFGAASSVFDMESALVEIQEQLKDSYCMETCSNCRNSFWNPYGGNEFFNQLCFRSEAEAFQAIEEKDKMSIVRFMKYDNDRNFQNVQLTAFCDEFVPR